jgi:peptidoglycan/xylan/chitin deacetylase (PgdA/CDA1 family)
LYFVKTPNIIKPLYRDFIWNLPNDSLEVYLTFDDGPTPEITDQVFKILAEFDALATFFLVGENIENHPSYLDKYSQLGHSIGNHSYSHFNGWHTEKEKYLEDIARCGKIIPGKLFRPPYGKITRSQAKEVKTNYKLIMWDVLSGDFDSRVDGDQCTLNVTTNVESGSIIVFHDSLKASKTMLTSLPQILGNLSERGFKFKALA